MQKYILLVLLFLFFSECCMVQPKIPTNEGSREKAYSMLEKSNISKELKRKPYLLFSIKDKWYYIISKNKTVFKEYFVVLDSQGGVENTVEKTLTKADNILANSFNSNSYHKGLIDLNLSLIHI